LSFHERFGDLRGRALWVVFGCLVCQLGLGFGYVTAPLLKDITVSLDISRSVWSSAGSARIWVISLASPVLGLMVVRFGARPILVVASLMLAPAFFWFSIMNHVWELVGANLLLGFVLLGFGDVTLGAVVTTWIARGRGLALGVVYTGSNLAGVILPPLVTYFAARGSWRQALLYVGIGGTLLILPFAARVVRERGAGGAMEAVSISASNLGHQADLDLGAALKTRSFWVLGFALAGFFFYMIGILEHFIASLTDSGLSRADAAGYFSAAIGMGLASKVLMGAVADRISSRPAILIDFGLLALSSGVLLFVPERPFLQVFVVLFGFSYAARDVVYPLVIAECFGIRYLAAIYGALMVVLAPAGTLGGVFSGFCFDRFGSYDVAFQTFAIVNVLVFGSLFLLRPEKELVHG